MRVEIGTRRGTRNLHRVSVEVNLLRVPLEWWKGSNNVEEEEVLVRVNHGGGVVDPMSGRSETRRKNRGCLTVSGS